MIVRKLITLLGFDVDEAGAREYEKKLDSLADKAASLMTKGAAMTAAFTAPFALALNSVVKSGGDYEQIMNRVQAAGNFTADQMVQIRAAADQMSEDMGKSLTDVGATLEELTKAGVPLADMLGGVAQQALTLSSATGAASDAAGTLINSVISLFGKSADYAGDAADQIVGFANATRWGFEDVQGVIQQSGNAAKLAGMDFDQLLAAASLMADTFDTGGEAGTALKSAIMSLMNPTKQARDVMEQYGLSFYDANGKMRGQGEIADMLAEKLGTLSDEERNAALATMFGSEGISYATALMDKRSAGLEANAAAIRDQGDAAAAAEAATAGYNGAVAKLSAAFERLAIAVANSGVLDFLTSLVEQGTRLIDKISELNPRLLSFGTFAGMAAALIGPFLVALGAIVLTLGAIGAPLLAFAAAAAVAAGAVAAFWPEITALWSAIGAGDWSSVGTMLSAGFGEVLTLLGDNLEYFILGLPGIIAAALGLDLFKPIKDAFTYMIDDAKKAWANFIDSLPAPVKAIGSAIRGAWNFVTQSAPVEAYGAPAVGIGAPGRAGGGAVNEGQAYTIGESGKELFMPTSDGVILPNGITRALEAMTNAAALSGGYGAPDPAPRGGGNITVSAPMTVSVTVPQGTTGEQAQSIFEQLETVVNRSIGNAIQNAIYDFPTMEAPV
ncbi:phage tail tape measure protein [Sphingomonas sp.]|uniref:phage tail tape measure protein n=1 Tax=Sphingomonas sp. TaxID=28214 RepID=UPI002DD67311|nr:phage tail tape measure protein [Sphingomonas sp.]